jgi:hypothetical protein
MSVLDMAFYPVPMEVLGNLLFFSLRSIILFFFLGSAIYSFSVASSAVSPTISSSASDVMSSRYESAV